MGERRKNRDRLDKLIGAWTCEKERYDLMKRLQAVGVPAGVVIDVPAALEDPQFRARGAYAQITHLEAGAGIIRGTGA